MLQSCERGCSAEKRLGELKTKEEKLTEANQTSTQEWNV